MNLPQASAHAVVGGLVLTAFTAISVLAYLHPAALANPAGAAIMSTFSALGSAVVYYYFGSSAGSAAKTAILAGQTPAAPAAPAQVMPPLSDKPVA